MDCTRGTPKRWAGESFHQITFERSIWKKWRSDVEASSKCVLYKSFKTSLKFEKYLTEISGNYRRLIIRFRLCNHKLTVENGRYNNIERHRRYCDLCNCNVLGDEYHTLMECRNITVLNSRKRVMKDHIDNVSMYNFVHIMSNIFFSNAVLYSTFPPSPRMRIRSACVLRRNEHAHAHASYACTDFDQLLGVGGDDDWRVLTLGVMRA